MSEQLLLPGTSMSYSESDAKAFSRIELLISAAGGLSLSQVGAITGLEGTTIQNWVKRGWVSNPKDKKYNEAQVARILIINALKECVKLESIAQLMRYINGMPADGSGAIISESELFNYLCEALRVLGGADDFSRSGVEAVAEEVIRGYKGPYADSRLRLRKALSVMIFACVCTDVKRRTESMLAEVLQERSVPASEPAASDHSNVDAKPEINIEYDENNVINENANDEKPDSGPIITEEPDKPLVAAASAAPQRSWFFKKGS